MKKFIPVVIIGTFILATVSCRQADELNDAQLSTNENTGIMKTPENKTASITKINDSIGTNQAVEETDPPVKTPIKW
ncbi:MAG: hypothetical protein WBI92_09855 [Cloacibacterium sp.]|jgi:hypothetical protein|uniref:hypothetical protein n=1 Tax=Cloacibacterium sp. TaxID=1913682 RepID=UPI003C70F4C0